MIADPFPPAIEVRWDGPLWRVRSTDGMLSGAFLDRRTALRHARDEAEAHPGYVVVVRPADNLSPSSE